MFDMPGILSPGLSRMGSPFQSRMTAPPESPAPLLLPLPLPLLLDPRASRITSAAAASSIRVRPEGRVCGHEPGQEVARGGGGG